MTSQVTWLTLTFYFAYIVLISKAVIAKWFPIIYTYILLSCPQCLDSMLAPGFWNKVYFNQKPRVPNYSNMLNEAQRNVLHDDVIGHVTIRNFLPLVACLFDHIRLRAPKYFNKSHATQGCVLCKDVINNMNVLKFFISLVFCLFRRPWMPNDSRSNVLKTHKLKWVSQ